MRKAPSGTVAGASPSPSAACSTQRPREAFLRRHRTAIQSKHFQALSALSPLEICAIGRALQEGARVPILADQYQVCRQTIYYVKNALPWNPGYWNNPASVPAKRWRNRGIPPELKDAIIQLRKKYPTWGVPCIREEVRKQ